MAEAVMIDYRTAALPDNERALMDYADKLTRHPANMTPDDLAALRANGYSERAILDASHIVGYFNYINRLADGLGVDLEPEMAPHPRPRT